MTTKNRQVGDLISAGCYACGAGLAGTAHAFLAIAEHTLSLTDEPHGSSVVSRRPVVVCRACAVGAGLVDEEQG